MEKHVLTLAECLLLVTPCTAKFWDKRLKEIGNELGSLLKDPNNGSKDDSIELVKIHSSTKEKLEKEKYQIQQNLLRLRVYEPGDQNNSISIGNGVVLSINNGKKKEIFLESISTGSCTKIVSLSSPLGEAIFGKKAGYKGTYRANGSIYSYEIFEVKPFTEAKNIFKEVPVVAEKADSMICF
jgi:transcription elongation GreA/GreB family factor